VGENASVQLKCKVWKLRLALGSLFCEVYIEDFAKGF
jgi:hypothetical protein